MHDSSERLPTFNANKSYKTCLKNFSTPYLSTTTILRLTSQTRIQITRPLFHRKTCIEHTNMPCLEGYRQHKYSVPQHLWPMNTPSYGPLPVIRSSELNVPGSWGPRAEQNAFNRALVACGAPYGFHPNGLPWGFHPGSTPTVG
jgi:hypothetical protein